MESHVGRSSRNDAYVSPFFLIQTVSKCQKKIFFNNLQQTFHSIIFFSFLGEALSDEAPKLCEKEKPPEINWIYVGIASVSVLLLLCCCCVCICRRCCKYCCKNDD